MSRSRTIRARRRIPGAAGALAGVAGVALAVTTLLPASHPVRAQLAAWTVAKQADGSIRVTIRELRDCDGTTALSWWFSVERATGIEPA